MDEESPAYRALHDAIVHTGSQTAFGQLCGVSQQAVAKWMKGRKPLPAEHVLTVEAATGISRHELRPDIYPPDGAPAPAPADSPAASFEHRR